MIRILAIGGVVMLTAACSSVSPRPITIPTFPEIKEHIQDVKDDLHEFTLNDLKAALVIAQKPPVDQVAATCYPVLITKLERKQAEDDQKAIGIVSLFEVARRIVHTQNAPDDSLQIACSALLNQTIKDVAKIAAKAGAIYASGGAVGIKDAPKAASALIKLLKGLGVGD